MNGTLYGQYVLVHPVGFDSQKHLTWSLAIFFECLKKKNTYVNIIIRGSHSGIWADNYPGLIIDWFCADSNLF